MVADQVSIAYTGESKEINLRKYIVALAIFGSRYWANGNAEAHCWALAAVRGDLGKLRLHRCDKCQRLSTDVRDVSGIRLCVGCIKEFIAARTMIQRHELPAPTPA